MLHLPYTSMVLSFVVVGALLSPRISWSVLTGTVLAYFAALGVGAHFLDQLPGMGSRYVHHWPVWALWTVGLSGVATGVAIGISGVILLGEPLLLPLVIVQGLCALGYPLAPLFRGVLHRESIFAVSWGSLPCLTSYYAQSGTISIVALLIAAAFAGVALLEIRVSRRSRELRGLALTDRAEPPSSLGRVASEFRGPDRILEVLSLGTTLLAIGLLAGRVLVPG
jgi:hypothetical protein